MGEGQGGVEGRGFLGSPGKKESWPIAIFNSLSLQGFTLAFESPFSLD